MYNIKIFFIKKAEYLLQLSIYHLVFNLAFEM